MNLSPPDLPLVKSPSPPPSLTEQQSSSLLGNLRSKARMRGRGSLISGGGGAQDDDDDDERSAAYLLSSKATHEKKAPTSTSKLTKDSSNEDTRKANNNAIATGLKLLAESREDNKQQQQQQSLAAISASIKRKGLGKKMKGALRRMVSHDDSIFSGHISNIHSAHTTQTVDNQEDHNNSNNQPITTTAESAGRSPKKNLTKKFNASMRSFITHMTPSSVAIQREGGDNSKRGRQRLTSVTSQVSLHLPLDLVDGNDDDDSSDGDNDGSIELSDAFLLQPEKKAAAEAKSDATKRRRERRQKESLDKNLNNINSSSQDLLLESSNTRLRRRHKQYRRVCTNQSATNPSTKYNNNSSSTMALNLNDSTGKTDRKSVSEDKDSNKEDQPKQHHHDHHHEHESRFSHSTSSKPRARSAPRSPSQKMVHRVREEGTPAQGGRSGEAFLLSVLDDIRAKKRASGELKMVLDDDDKSKDGDDLDADAAAAAAAADAKKKCNANKKKKDKKKTIKPKRPGAGLLGKDKKKNKPKPSSDTDALSPEEEEELALLGPEATASPHVRVVTQGGLGGWRRGSFLSEITMKDSGCHGSNIEEPTEEDVSTMMPSLDPCSQGQSDTGTGTVENEDSREDRKKATNPLNLPGSSSRRDSSKDDGDSVLRAMYEEDSLPLVKRSNDALRMEVEKNLKHLSILKQEDPPNSEGEFALKTEVENNRQHLSIIKQGEQKNALTEETSYALKMEIEKKLKIIIGEESGSSVRKREGRANRLEAETNLENFMVRGIQENPSGLTEEMDLSNQQQRCTIVTPKQGRGGTTSYYKDKFPFSLDSLIAGTKNGDSPTSMDDSVILDFKAYQAKENADATSSRRHGGLARRRSCPNFKDEDSKPGYSNLHKNLNFRFDTDDARFFASPRRETEAQPRGAAEDKRSVGSGSDSRRGRSRSSRHLVRNGVADRRSQKARRKENSARSLPSGERTNGPTKRTIKQLSDSHIDTKRIRDRSQSSRRHSSRVSKSLQSKSLSKREIAAEERERRKSKRTRRSISKSVSRRHVTQRERSRSISKETSREKSRGKHSSFRSSDEGREATARERSRSKSHRESTQHTDRDRSKSKSNRGAGLAGRHISRRSERLHQSESQINYRDRPRKRSQSKRSERGLSISDNAHGRLSSRPRTKSVESIKKQDKHPDGEIQASANDELTTGKKKTEKGLVDSTDNKIEKTKRREKKGRSDGRLNQSDGNLVYYHRKRSKSKSTRSRRSDDMPERSERKTRSERVGERTSVSVSNKVRTKGKPGMEAWGNQSDVTLNIRNIVDETGEEIHAPYTESHVSGRESRPSRRDSVDFEDRGQNRGRSRSLDRARRSQQIVNDAKEELEKLVRQSAVAGGARDGLEPGSPVSKSTADSQPSDVEWKRVTPDKKHSVQEKSDTDKEHIKSNGDRESSAQHRSSDKGPENSPRRKETNESDRPAAAEEVGWNRVATSNPKSEVKDESQVEKMYKKQGHRGKSKSHGESGTKSRDVSKSGDKKDDGVRRSRKERDSTDKKSAKRSSGGDRVDRSGSGRVSSRQQDKDKDKGEAKTSTTASTTTTKEHKSRHRRRDETRENSSRLHSSGIVTSTSSQQRRSRDGKDERRKCQSERQTRTIDKFMIVDSHHSSSSSERNDRTVCFDSPATPTD